MIRLNGITAASLGMLTAIILHSAGGHADVVGQDPTHYTVVNQKETQAILKQLDQDPVTRADMTDASADLHGDQVVANDSPNASAELISSLDTSEKIPFPNHGPASLRKGGCLLSGCPEDNKCDDETWNCYYSQGAPATGRFEGSTMCTAENCNPIVCTDTYRLSPYGFGPCQCPAGSTEGLCEHAQIFNEWKSCGGNCTPFGCVGSQTLIAQAVYWDAQPIELSCSCPASAN